MEIVLTLIMVAVALFVSILVTGFICEGIGWLFWHRKDNR